MTEKRLAGDEPFEGHGHAILLRVGVRPRCGCLHMGDGEVALGATSTAFCPLFLSCLFARI